MRFALFLLTFLLAPTVHAQQLAYEDADTPAEAIGMMNTTLVTSRKLLGECTARFPSHEQEMYENLRRWEEAERPAIIKTRHYFGLMAQRDAKLRELNSYVESSLDRVIDVFANAPGPQGVEVFQNYCRKQFADYASGVWRQQRTPRAYKFLDEVPLPGTGPQPTVRGSHAAQAHSYAERIRAVIRPHIYFTDPIEGNPVAEVKVQTHPDGQIVAAELVQSSGHPNWDEAVRKAVLKAGQLPRDVDGRVPSTLFISFKPKL